jgi:Mce-associated membrane protein
MPRGKERRAMTREAPAAEAPQETAEPEAPKSDAPGPEAATVEAPEPEAATDADEAVTAEEPEAKPRRRWNLLRRNKKAAAAEETTDEDAQTTAEPVTDASAEEKAEDTEADGEAAESDGEATESEGEESESEAETAEEPEPVLVPHEPAGRRGKIAAAAAAILFVAAAAFVAAMAQPVIANRAMVQTKLDIARTAQSAITTLWSYTPDNMDSLGDRSARYLTGDFASQYRKFIDSIVATNKQAQVTNTTDVLGTAVESVSGSEATALVYTNSVATSPVSKNIPSLRYLSYRLEMKRDHSDWRITRMTTITTLDLTPQL